MKYDKVVEINRRYSRSINVERDYDVADALRGYLVGNKALEILDRFANAYQTKNSVSSFTLTGVYGTGKSAFAQFLVSLCAAESSDLKQEALSILKGANAGTGKKLAKFFQQSLPETGLIRAVATARSEAIEITIARALKRGIDAFLQNKRGSKPKAYNKIVALNEKIEHGQEITDSELLSTLRETLEGGFDVLLVIDELGKSLEYASHSKAGDLYLLQQIAELQASKKGTQVYFFGLLHQSFSGYASSLTEKQKKEWSKIQGRFEDISFLQSDSEVLRLVGHAFEIKKDHSPFDKRSKEWQEALSGPLESQEFDAALVASVYPLHPLAAKVLPVLCNRFAQNDRSLFTFLGSNEAHSFGQFLSETDADSGATLKLDKIYDYFAESAGLASSSRSYYQKWIEIHARIYETKNLSPILQSVLKVIGVLNLAATGKQRASKELVILSLLDNPQDKKARASIEACIAELEEKSIVLYRRKLNEYQLWEGSDFDIEAAIEQNRSELSISVASVLNHMHPFRPQVVARHSYQFGTLRFLQPQFADSVMDIVKGCEAGTEADGLLYYYIGAKQSEAWPKKDRDGKPVIIMTSSHIDYLKEAALDYLALKGIAKEAPELLHDSVARREVNTRLSFATQTLNDCIATAFQLEKVSEVIVTGEAIDHKTILHFNQLYSDCFDNTYNKKIIIKNELINRKKLSTAASRARKLLIDRMVANTDVANFGIEGDGPEVAIMKSLILATGIFDNDKLEIVAPTEQSNVYGLWAAIAKFFEQSTNEPRNLADLYKLLQRPPYGVREPVIAVYVMLALMYYREKVSFYEDGSFVPVIRGEHVELLLRKPAKYSVKYVALEGIKLQIFEMLYNSLNETAFIPKQKNLQNKGLVAILKPLVILLKNLSNYAANTKNLPEETILVRNLLQTSNEPDKLIFYELPKALGLDLLEDSQKIEITVFRYKIALSRSLTELQQATANLIESCANTIHQNFELVQGREKMRQELTDRSLYLVEKCIEPKLRRFLIAVTDQDSKEPTWLESVIMVVADKPVESFTDDDALTFELKIADLYRRFKNLELLQRTLGSKTDSSFVAKRVTITSTDGNEIDELVRLDNENTDKQKSIAEIIEASHLNELSIADQRAVLTLLLEKKLKPAALNELKRSKENPKGEASNG